MLKTIIKIFAVYLLLVFSLVSLFPVSLSFAHEEHYYKPECWNDGTKDDGDGGDREPEVDPNTGVKLPYCGKEGDPVNVFNGNFEYRYQDIFIPSRGMPFEFTRYYNSRDLCEGPLGQGWSHTFNITLFEVKNGPETFVLRRNYDGALHVFRQISDTGFEKITLDGYDVLKRYVVFPESLRSLAPSGLIGGYHIREKQGKDYLFDFDGKLRVVADRNKNRIILEYDGAQRLVHILDTVNRQYTLDYNMGNKILSITDFSGRKYAYNYNAQGILESVIMPKVDASAEGNTTRYDYNAKNQLVNITDPQGNSYLNNTYDDLGRVVEQKYGSALYRFVYENLKTTFIDGNGNLKEHYFNADGTTQKEVIIFNLSGIAPLTSANTIYYGYEYNSNKEITLIVLPRQNRIRKEYDANGNLVKVLRGDESNPESLVTIMTYEPNYNMLKTLTDPKGNTTAFDYDEHGNLLKITYPQVSGQTPVAEFTYNQYGQLETAKDPNQIVTKYEYNSDTGYLSKVMKNFGTILPLNGESANYAETQFDYDNVGNVTSVTDSLGNTTNFEYDVLNNLIKSVAPLPFAYETLFSYDKNGNLVRFMRQANSDKTDWEIIGYEYDARDILTAVKQYKNDDTFLLTTFAYDNNGNCLQVVNAEGQHTMYGYDGMNRVNQVIDAEGKVTLYQYDKNGTLDKIEDANGNVTIYEYDEFDRLSGIHFPDNSRESYTHDKNSNLIKKITRRASLISYEYDALNRLTKKSCQNQPATVYGYDIGSRLISIQNSAALIQYTYNGLNKVIQVQNQMPNLTSVIGYNYDAAGNQTKLTYPDATAITYAYDTLHRLIAVNDQSPAVIAAYNYDVLSRRTQLTYVNNTHVAYQYDELNRLIQLAHFPGSRLPTYSFDYDAIGNRKTMSVNGTDWHYYEYDKISQLKAIDFPEVSEFPDTWYMYDNVGNRKTATFGETTHYSTNNLNQYTQVGIASLAYDENGNLTSDPVTPAIGTNSYVYDDENRLIQATTADNIIEYQYDGFGRRIAKKLFNTQYALLTTQYYVYDGGQVIAEYDGNGTLQQKYVYGPGIDEPVQLIVHSSSLVEKYWYHADGLGSIIGLTDASGSLVESYEYDAYGNTIIRGPSNEQRAASSCGNRFGFTGRELDSETGLYYYRARMYSPELGRFLQPDPIGYYDSMNLYQYCGNNPGNYTDPYGLWGVWFGDIHLGNDRPWFVFNTESWFDVEKGAYATIDGINPFGDPFEDQYAPKSGKCDPESIGDEFEWSKWLGGLSRDLFLAAGMVNLLAEFGFIPKTVPIDKVSPNLADEFFNPNIGPSHDALHYARDYMIKNGFQHKAIDVIRSGAGYQITNGHHVWKAAVQLGRKFIKVRIGW